MIAVAPRDEERFVKEPLHVERYALAHDGTAAIRSVSHGHGWTETRISAERADPGLDAFATFDQAWLRSTSPPEQSSQRGEIKLVDLFSGCGGMSLGATEAARATGIRTKHVLAVDTNAAALAVYKTNFPESAVANRSVLELLDSDLGAPSSAAEHELKRAVGEVDIALAGPPCQGNSDLNNFTRRQDPKNRLYLSMARFAEVIRPNHLVIENVPGVLHDRGKVVERTIEALDRLGYNVTAQVLEADQLGVAQKRRRFVLVASLDSLPEAGPAGSRSVPVARTLEWAISDLLDPLSQSLRTFDTSARHHGQNQERMEFLLAHDLYDLPNERRPDCHRLKVHSYGAVYGRMRWDQPTQTITTGFGSTGQGRYVHPLRPRTLSPHEAARVQFIPDFFAFPEPRRRMLQELIGNAVPPKLAYAVVLPLLAR